MNLGDLKKIISLYDNSCEIYINTKLKQESLLIRDPKLKKFVCVISVPDKDYNIMNGEKE